MSVSSTPSPAGSADTRAPFDLVSVVKSSPNVGAEVGNIDLTQPLSPAVVDELQRAFAQNGVLFFRNQKMSFEDHKRLARYFGELHVHVGPKTASVALDEDPAVRLQHYDAASAKVSGELWHTDQSCAAIPPLGSILIQHVVPPNGGGDTLFANMYEAYDHLSESMKAYLEPLYATHDGSGAFGRGAPVNVHPVIVRHPVTGRKLIYVNPGQTTQIKGVGEDESKSVLTYLFGHCVDPRWTFRFRWEPFSIAFWDNRCMWHRAIWDYYPNTRSGYRVQITAPAPPAR